VDPEELTGLEKYNYESKMGITPSDYYHKLARRDKAPEGYFQKSRSGPTKKEAYLQEFVEHERNAIENGAKTWAEIPKDVQKLMEEQLLPETISKLKGAKKPITDEDLKIVAHRLPGREKLDRPELEHELQGLAGVVLRRRDRRGHPSTGSSTIPRW
jgi:hypothetical protein